MRFLSKITPVLLFFCFVVLYIHNLSPSVYGGDVGDFVTTAYIGGVAHAPGYPFFVLLGFVMIHLFSFFTPAFAMGLISALAGAGGVVVAFLTVRRLTKSTLVSVVASLCLGLSYIFWFYNEIAEVFALHSFFILTLFYFAFSYDSTKRKKWLFLFAFVFGLAAVTHQTIALFIPSFLLLLIVPWWHAKKRLQLLFLSLSIMLSAGLWYIYVFIASSHHPVINWDNVHDVSSFLQLVLRKDYGTFNAGVFQGPAFTQRIVILKAYLFEIMSQVTIPVITVSVIGLIGIWRKSRRYFFSLLLAFLLAGPLFVGYAGFPLEGSFFFGVYERFFTMSTLPIFLLFGYGLFLLSKWFSDFFQRQAYFQLIPILFLLVPLQLFLFNMPKTDLSQVWVGDMLGADFLRPLPPHSIVLIGGDTALFNTWYMHYARHVRPDIVLVNVSLATQDPFVQKEEKLVQKQNPHLKGNELVAQTLLEIVKSRAVFSYDQLQAPGKTNLYWVPSGLLYRLYTKDKALAKDDFIAMNVKTLQQIHPPISNEKNYKNYTLAHIPELYAKPIWAIGNYLFNTYKDTDAAITYYKKAIAIDPDYENTYLTLGIAYLTDKNDCLHAKETFLKAIDLKPYDELPYFLLYSSYTECYQDTEAAKKVTKVFESQFHKDFFSELAFALKQFKLTK